MNESRTITIEAGPFDHPVDLQMVQEAGAQWNGENVQLTLNIVIAGRLEILRTIISYNQAVLFASRLKVAINDGAG